MKSTKLFLSMAVAITGLLASPAAAQDLYVVHGINGSDLALPAELPVDIAVGGGCTLTNFQFEDIAGPVPVDPGLYLVEVRLADAADPCAGPLVVAINASVALAESATIVAHLTGEGAITATKFTNDLRPVGADEARLVVRHTALAPAVDVFAQQGTSPAFIAFADLENRDQAGVVIPAARTSVALAPAGTTDVVFGPVSGTPAGSTANFVYAVGSLDSGTFTLLLQSLSTP